LHFPQLTPYWPTFSASAANRKSHTSNTFYLEHRKAVAFARDDPSEAIPVFKNLEEWEPIKSTKLDLCARICQYILSSDSAPQIHFEDGVPIFPPIVPSRAETQETKVLIYQEFPSFTGLLRNVSSFFLFSGPSIILYSLESTTPASLYGSPTEELIFRCTAVFFWRKYGHLTVVNFF
jgi:hypothetical protein